MERIARESVEDLPEQVETIRGDLVQRQVRGEQGIPMELVARAAGLSSKPPPCLWPPVCVDTTGMQARRRSLCGPA